MRRVFALTYAAPRDFLAECCDSVIERSSSENTKSVCVVVCVSMIFEWFGGNCSTEHYKYDHHIMLAYCAYNCLIMPLNLTTHSGPSVRSGGLGSSG